MDKEAARRAQRTADDELGPRVAAALEAENRPNGHYAVSIRLHAARFVARCLQGG